MTRSPLLLLSAPVILAGAVAVQPLLAHADIAGYPESSEEVRVYRALEKQFSENPEAQAAVGHLAHSMCPDEVDDRPVSPPERRDVQIQQAVRFGDTATRRPRVIKTYAKCYLTVDTLCTQGHFGLQTDGRWTWTMSRVGYIRYIRDLTARAGFPESVVGADLKALELLTMNNIERRLKRPMGLQKLDGEEGGMGLNNDSSFAKGRLERLEAALAWNWTTYLAKLPPSRQASLPAFEYDPSCGGGEIPVTTKTDPPGALVRIISDYDWLLCQALGRDPWDPDRCIGWSLLVKPENWLIGRYRYQADWSNGKRSRNAVDITGDPDSLKTVVTFR